MKLTKRTKRLLIAGALVLGLPIGAILLLAQNSARYPGAGVTTGDLFIASNYATTTLLTQISATATSATVASGSGFVAPQLVSIDSEIMSVCQVSGNTLTFGRSACPNADGRGYDGSVAVSHIASRPVEGRVVAWLHNQVAAEVIAIEIRPMGKFYAPAYASLANAVAAAAATSGTVVCPTAYTALVSTTVMIPGGVTLEGQPGCVVQAAANVVPLAVSGTVDGVTIDGQFTQRGYTSSCVTMTGTGTVIRNSTVRNCSDGVIGTGVANARVYGNNFTGVNGDPVRFTDNVNGLEIYSNTYNTTGSRSGAHCIGVYSTGTSAGINGVFNVNIHDERFTMAQTNPCVEVGYFGSARPIPSWPSNITISHMKGFALAGTTSFFVSLSNAQNYSVSDIQIDDNGQVYVALELAIASHGQVWGVTEINPNAAQGQSILINDSSYVDVGGFDLKGHIHVFEGTQQAPGEPTSMSHIAIHDGKIALQPSFPQASLIGPIWVQQSLASVGQITDVNIHDNQLTGVSTTDGNIAVALENDTGAGTSLDSVKVHHNSLSNIQYGFSNRTNNGTVSNIDISANSIGAGVAECNAFCAFYPGQLNNFAVNQTGTGNKLGLISSFAAPGLVATGAKPTCTPGAAAGAGATCTVISGTPFHGLVNVLTAGTTAGGLIFTLNMPISYVSIPFCTWTDGGNTPDATLFVYNRPTSTATTATWAVTAVPVTGMNYSVIYDCPLTPF